jgi:hypothetical protein
MIKQVRERLAIISKMSTSWGQFTGQLLSFNKRLSNKSLSLVFGDNFFFILSKIGGNIRYIDQNFTQNGGEICPKDGGKDSLGSL